LKTEISPWIYFVSVFSVLLISLGTILFRILRSVRANPVDALRYE
jgi:ABC-type lipoprotein release transport system permease subunit